MYEGWVYGVGEWEYSKVAKLLKGAFETAEYTYLEDKLGAVYVRGHSDMFEEDEENRTATFDLLADQVAENGKGHVLATTFAEQGDVTLGVYVFGHKAWDYREVPVGG